jgi:hypothetical protein
VLQPGPDVQDGRGHGGPERLQDRVAPGNELSDISRAARRPA